MIERKTPQTIKSATNLLIVTEKSDITTKTSSGRK
jgi:hypothetical protein